jgi:hypothetical protein
LDIFVIEIFSTGGFPLEEASEYCYHSKFVLPSDYSSVIMVFFYYFFGYIIIILSFPARYFMFFIIYCIRNITADASLTPRISLNEKIFYSMKGFVNMHATFFEDGNNCISIIAS